ncbi:hypothetical protein LCGC14_0836710 [marine sediment metagenome]|uniref:Uncharacterized protein n=1 Tax=marine sediment metagenome TaxID=412755 RepID=A0A0F9PZK5_9ZZZZ
MPRLKINAPDGKVLRVELPSGATEDQYDAIADDVLKDYAASKVEQPGTLKSGALGVMSGIPGAQTLTSAIGAIGDPTYEESHRNLEILKNKAWEEHPVAYGAGKGAGFVGTALATPASIPGAVAIGAGAGLDVASKPEEFLAAGAKGAAMGGTFGAAGKHIVGPAISKVVNKFAPAVGKRAVASLGKPTLKHVESYLKDPKAIREGLTDPQMAEKLAKTISGVEAETKTLGTSARKLLDPEVAPLTAPLPKLPVEPTGLVSASGKEIMKDLTREQTFIPDTLSPIFTSLKSRYLQNGVPKSAAAKSAINALDAQFIRMQKIARATGGKLDEVALKEQIVELQHIAKKAFTDDNVVSTSKDALKNLSGALNQVLKDSNSSYGAAMQPVAKRTALIKDIAKKFSLDPTDAGYSPTEATNIKMGGILKESKTESQDMLKRLQDLTGVDFLKVAETAQTKSAFTKPGSSQGMNVIAHTAGYGIGALSGIPGGRLIGSLLGGVAGHNIEGGQMAKRILDAYLSKSTQFSNSAMAAVLEKYGPILMNAAKAGGNQLAATHFVLGTSDPEYQELENQMAGQ